MAHTDDVVSLLRWLMHGVDGEKLMSFLSQSRQETSPHSETGPTP